MRNKTPKRTNKRKGIDEPKRAGKSGKSVSIKMKLLGVLLPIGIVMIGLLTAASYFISKDVIKEYSENLLSSSIENQANEIQSWLNENLSAFQIVKQTIEGVQPDDALLQKMLDQYYGFNSNYPNGIYIADESGKLMKASESTKTESDPTSSVWYKEGLTRINMGFTKAYTNANGEDVISASGILNDGSGVQKIISADMSLQRIGIIVNSFIEMKNAEAFLVDQTNNKILVHRDSSLIHTVLDEGNEDPFLSGVAKKLVARDYALTEIDGNMTAFQKVQGTNWILVSYIPTSVIYASVERLKNSMFTIGIICILILALLLERTVHLMIRPIKELTKAITMMTNGDFTIEVKSRSNDEIGTMSRGVEQFVTSMRSMISSIHGVADELHTQADDSYVVSREMLDASSLQGRSMEELNNTVEQFADSVNEIAEHATTLAMVVADTRDDSDKVKDKMKETVEISEQGKRDMGQVDAAIKNIKESIGRLKEAIDKVGAASDEITNITAVIGDIAEETNLLSLNASIEAARAGEAGRGFAVVATQIGKLAQTSAESVQTIENLIHQINELVTDCVNQADDSAENIMGSGQLIETALHTFNVIFENIGMADELVHSMVEKVEKVDDVANNVAAISQQQAASSEEILATSDTMVEQAKNITENSESVANEAKELTKSSKILANQIKAFKI